jgi:hypothetical protein
MLPYSAAAECFTLPLDDTREPQSCCSCGGAHIKIIF